MTLTYWTCHSLRDHSCYNFRALTKRECLAWLADPAEGEWRRQNYSRPCKVEVLAGIPGSWKEKP